MADHLTRDQRSALMARVRGKDTSPEMLVRRILHGFGYRYRLHRRDLPGKPDLVFASRRKVIFVHGCFWHQHNCAKAKRPETNKRFWNDKLDRNIARDRTHMSKLGDMGWEVLVVWECQTADRERLAGRLKNFLEGRS